MSWEHQAADKIVHLVDRWSTIAVGLAGAVAAVWMTIAKAVGPWLKRKRDMEAVEKRSVNAWLMKRVETLEKENAEWQERWSREVKERAKDSELFLRALERQRVVSSAPPPISSSTSGTKTPRSRT